jgi:hypothetical protein
MNKEAEAAIRLIDSTLNDFLKAIPQQLNSNSSSIPDN